ncbi:MAG: site-specific integrase [Planctomycetota bacterium]|nr:site-specific integrase [Planctomycetota bacterium]
MSVFKRKRAEGGKRRVTESKIYYIDFFDHADIRRRLPAFADKTASNEMERNISRLVALRMAGGGPDAESSRFLQKCPPAVREKLGDWGIIDIDHAAGGRRLSNLLVGWDRNLEARQTSPKYRTEAVARVQRILTECSVTFLNDLRAEKIEWWLAGERRKGMSNRTSNSHLSSIKAFCNWMVKAGYSSVHPLARLSNVNEATDIRLERRDLDSGETRLLLDSTRKSQKIMFKMSGWDRFIMYLLALETGLRWNELRTLRRNSFDLKAEPATVTIEAKSAKNRRRDILPLRRETVRLLEEYFAAKPALPAAPALPMPAGSKGASIIKRDMKEAGIVRTDDLGRVADFHSLRHTFISNLAKAGIHPKLAQDLARHSTIELTMKVYTHTKIESRLEAIDKLPVVTASAVLPLAKTGTADAPEQSGDADPGSSPAKAGTHKNTDTKMDTKRVDFSTLSEQYLDKNRNVFIGSNSITQKNNPLNIKGLTDWSGRRESDPRI